MAKKRNCRRTPEEASIHEEAVKLRKMTDVSLSKRFALRLQRQVRCLQHQVSSAKSAAEFLEAFANANIPGVGKITLKKMKTFAKDNGYL